MTVINTLEGFCDCFREHSRCCTCGGELVLPFLLYCAGGDGLFLCGQCAHHVRNGLTADLVQLSAIVELQQLYPNKTLVRRDTATLEEEQRQRWSQQRQTPPSGIRLVSPSD